MNAPPKPATDCGVTAMCPVPVSAHHDAGVPLWAAEIVMFALLLAVAAVAYRLLLARHR